MVSALSFVWLSYRGRESAIHWERSQFDTESIRPGYRRNSASPFELRSELLYSRVSPKKKALFASCPSAEAKF